MHGRRHGVPESAKGQAEQGVSDRLFWEAVYRAVLALATAIKKYKIEPPAQ